MIHFIKRQRAILVTTFLIILIIIGCAPQIKQLGEFKDKWQQRDYQWIADQKIDCKSNEEGCNQLHLLKGDACYRIAKQSDDSLYYEMAATHLEMGIQQTKAWELENLNLDQTQTYINLCESLRNLQDKQTGNTSVATGERFFIAAASLNQLEPENPAAVFFFNKASFRRIQPAIVRGLNPQENCQKVKKMLSEVNDALSRSAGSVYQKPLDRLKIDLSTILTTIEGCDK